MSAESKKASDRATLKISAVPTNLTAEISARGTAEGLLGGRITTEITTTDGIRSATFSLTDYPITYYAPDDVRCYRVLHWSEWHTIHIDDTRSKTANK